MTMMCLDLLGIWLVTSKNPLYSVGVDHDPKNSPLQECLPNPHDAWASMRFDFRLTLKYVTEFNGYSSKTLQMTEF